MARSCTDVSLPGHVRNPIDNAINAFNIDHTISIVASSGLFAGRAWKRWNSQELHLEDDEDKDEVLVRRWTALLYDGVTSCVQGTGH